MATMRRVDFAVAGIARPQGSKRPIINRHTGRVAMVESANAGTRKALESWRDDIAGAAQDCQAAIGGAPIEAEIPVSLTLLFCMAKPRSATKRTHPAVRPDLDKLVRAVFDALRGRLYADDAQVCHLETDKVYPDNGWTGVVISLREMA